MKVYSLWWSIFHVRKIGMFLCLLIVSGSNLNKVSEEWLFPFMLIKNSVCLSRIGIYNKLHERVHVCSCSILSVPKHTEERLCFLKFPQIRYAGEEHSVRRPMILVFSFMDWSSQTRRWSGALQDSLCLLSKCIFPSPPINGRLSRPSLNQVIF